MSKINEYDIENKILYRFGVLFSKKRKELGMSIRELSRESGVSPSVIVDLENSKSLPSIKILIRLCIVLGINFNEISECLRVLGTEPSPKESNLVMALTEYGYTKDQIAQIVDYAEYIGSKNNANPIVSKDEIAISSARKLCVWFGEDSLGRYFVAGGAGSGKTAVMKKMAEENDFYYFNDEEKPWKLKPMACQEFLDWLAKSSIVPTQGVVLDCDVKRHFTDFETFQWSVPIIYRIQTNREGKVNYNDYKYFRLLQLEKAHDKRNY